MTHVNVVSILYINIVVYKYEKTVLKNHIKNKYNYIKFNTFNFKINYI